MGVLQTYRHASLLPSSHPPLPGEMLAWLGLPMPWARMQARVLTSWAMLAIQLSNRGSDRGPLLPN